MWFWFRSKPKFRKYNWTHIIVHHSWSTDHDTLDWQSVRRYHRDNLGWSVEGYHFGIEKINGEYEILMGRPLNMNGAHTRGMNEKSIGLCVIGQFDTNEVPKEAYEKLSILVKMLMDMFKIKIDNVKKHQYYSSYKTCPGTKFDMDYFKREFVNKI